MLVLSLLAVFAHSLAQPALGAGVTAQQQLLLLLAVVEGVLGRTALQVWRVRRLVAMLVRLRLPASGMTPLMMAQRQCWQR
jgi:hypothetical protein